MNEQIASLVRSALKIGGTAAVCIGAADPALGGAIGDFVTAAGALATSVGVLWSFKSHLKVSF